MLILVVILVKLNLLEMMEVCMDLMVGTGMVEETHGFLLALAANYHICLGPLVVAWIP